MKVSRSNFQDDGAAAFKLWEISPSPPALSSKDLPRRQTQVFNVHQIWRIDCHLSESDEDSSPKSISDTEYWLTWNGDLDNANESEDDCKANDESDIEPGKGIKCSECP
jgi:hypothetical protein